MVQKIFFGPKMDRDPEKAFTHIVDYRDIFGNIPVRSHHGRSVPKLPDFGEWEEDPEHILLAESILRRSNPDLQRGDLMRISGWKYRNDGVFIYDGQHFINLDSTVDDYGNVPEQFTIEEFPIDYWYDNSGNGGIDHNTVVWIPKHMIPKDLKAFSENDSVDFYYTEFITRGKKVLLCLMSEDENEEFPDLIPFDNFGDAPDIFTSEYGEENVYVASGKNFYYPY